MASPSSTSGLPGSSRLSEMINRSPMKGFSSAPSCRVITPHRSIQRWCSSVWLRISSQPQPAPAQPSPLNPPVRVSSRSRSNLEPSNSVHPSQTVNGGIKDGIDRVTHRPKPFHSSRSSLLHTDTLSVQQTSPWVLIRQDPLMVEGFSKRGPRPGVSDKAPGCPENASVDGWVEAGGVWVES
jgi:hypothetical protein